MWLDPDLAATYEVIEEVLSQVANIFPGPFLLIGGNEPFGMPEDLYAAYVRHVIRFVRSIGKQTVGFQETMRAGVDPRAARDELYDRMLSLRAACEDGDRRACVRLGIIIGENRERRAAWRREHPEVFFYER